MLSMNIVACTILHLIMVEFVLVYKIMLTQQHADQASATNNTDVEEILQGNNSSSITEESLSVDGIHRLDDKVIIFVTDKSTPSPPPITTTTAPPPTTSTRGGHKVHTDSAHITASNAMDEYVHAEKWLNGDYTIQDVYDTGSDNDDDADYFGERDLYDT
jgi:hypothetical protein